MTEVGLYRQVSARLQGHDVEDGGDGALAAGLARGGEQLQRLLIAELDADVDRVAVKRVARIELVAAARQAYLRAHMSWKPF